MPRIAAVATANPSHAVSQEHARSFAAQIYGDNKVFLRLQSVFDNAGVSTRYVSADPKWLASQPSFTETNDLYCREALALSERVTLEVCESCKISPADFDVVFFLSTTGVSAPSIDAHLFNRIGLNPHVKRIPIWGLGCAAGAAGLARAYDYLKAYPCERALVLSVELCSLSFRGKNASSTDIVASALFGDGAAACAVFGDEVPSTTSGRLEPTLLGSLSTIYPNTLEVMGWRGTSAGFEVQLSQSIPQIVTTHVKDNIETLLKKHALSIDNLEYFVFHPGGAKVLNAYADGMRQPAQRFESSFGVLRDFGNMSSATVFFVLQRELQNHPAESNDYGLVAALGPGFSSELVLLRWA
jgi:alkylresorcinol/alkylpyrone synthase